jgi:hypothetical protein
MANGLRQAVEGVEKEVALFPKAEEPIDRITWPRAANQWMVQRIAEQGQRGSSLFHVLPQPPHAEPRPARQWPVHQERPVELAGVAGDDAILLQGPLRTDLVPDVLKPDPAVSLWVVEEAETPRRCQAARQVIQPPGLVSVGLALVIVPGTGVGTATFWPEYFEDQGPGLCLALIATLP